MLGRFIEPRIRRLQTMAAGLLEGLDDRCKLIALELGQESRWLARLAVLALASLIIVIITLVWLMATGVALAWDTPWRIHVLIGAAAFWLILSLGLLLSIRSMLRKHPSPFPLTRQVLAEDAHDLRNAVKHDGDHHAAG